MFQGSIGDLGSGTASQTREQEVFLKHEEKTLCEQSASLQSSVLEQIVLLQERKLERLSRKQEKKQRMDEML